ncbi:MAG: hypothetical protein ACT4OZ_16160 [Gemmatimonadota bacterium]
MALQFLIPIALFASMAVVAVNFIRYQQRKLELGAAGPDQSRSIDARLDRIEQAIDSMAVEMERLAEGQRFTTHLLAGGSEPASPAVRR